METMGGRIHDNIVAIFSMKLTCQILAKKCSAKYIIVILFL